jgi:gliding motility-associated-like protein
MHCLSALCHNPPENRLAEKHHSNLMYYEVKTLRKHLLALFVLLYAASPSFAQPHAGFTATPRTGCSPILVTFIDTSSGVPTNWHWDLGNNVISSLRSPSTTYITPGTYTVKLVVSNAQGADSVTRVDYITVLPSPDVDFNAISAVGCTPLISNFTNLSTSTVPIVSSSWDLGDGNGSNLSNPSHTYLVPGQYSITLFVTNSAGCSKAVTKPQYIQVGVKPTASFTNTSPSNCTLPFNVDFTATSGGVGNTYSWTFGDGGTGTGPTASHIYTTAGTYSVKMVVVNQFGCRDSIIKNALINVGSTTAFTVVSPVCAGQGIALTNSSVPVASSQSWDFGDATSSTAALPVKSYTTPGNYVIKLTNQFAGGCTDLVTHNITVLAKPTADFSANQTVACSAPLAVNFTSVVTGATTYSWTFGDGGLSNLPNPSHTYTTEGFYTVTLTVTSANGCTETVTKPGYISVQKPSISIAGLPKSGCSPLTIFPVPTVQTNETVTSYAWTFGDGGTSNLPNPSYTYNANGVYTVTLTITTSSGCTNTVTLPDVVQTNAKPTANFTFTPANVCATMAVQFTNTSTGTTPNTVFTWNFGDGGISSQINPSYNYQDTGTFSVTLIAANATCRDTLHLLDNIHVLPPIARFTVAGTCTDKLTKIFTDHSIVHPTIPAVYAWDFGDGGTSAVQNPSHTYAASGTYTVTLSVTVGSCTHTTTLTVLAIGETAAFTQSKTFVCKGDPVNFTAIGINAANISSWTWDFGDGATSPAANSASHGYSSSNTFTVTLSITDLNGCTDMTTHTVTAGGPFANFTQTIPSACFTPGGNSITFTDASTSDGTAAIVKSIWNFGDGSNLDSSGVNPIAHIYTAPGIYPVDISVRDQNGCYGFFTVTSAVVISQPTAQFSSNDTVTCTNRGIAFSNQSTGNAPLVYAWDFGDGTTSALPTPVHNYTYTDTFTVTLTITDAYGCTSTVTRPDYIKISFPTASFTASSLFANCPPLIDTFVNHSTNATSQLWSFGDGGTSTLRDSTFKIYNLAGLYNVTLTVRGPGGCTDDTTQVVEILGPQGTFTYNPQSGCMPFLVSLSATTTHADSLIWDYGDGNVLWTQVAPTNTSSHVFSDTGSFQPRIILKDNTGCTVSIFGPSVIHSYKVFPSLSADIFNLCDSGIVQFSGLSISNDAISGWQWDFGDGGTGNTQNTQHTYTSPGTYTATLTNTSAAGCTGAASSLPITVNVSPKVAVLPGLAEACVPANFTFQGDILRNPTGTLSWSWDFGNGQTANVQNPGPQSYITPNNYLVTLKVLHTNGCRDSVTRNVLVRSLPIVNAGPDTLFLCRDSVFTLTPTGASTYIWNPSASLSCLVCQNPVASPLNNVKYFVTGTDAFGCVNRDSLQVVVRQPFPFRPPVLLDSLCLGSSVTLSAGGGDTYSWSPRLYLDDSTSANPRVTPDRDTTITYMLVVSDRNGCRNDTAFSTVHAFPIPRVDAGPDMLRPAGDTATLLGNVSPDATSLLWIPSSNLSCSTCPNPVATARFDQIYRLLVRNGGGCTSFDDMRVTVTCGGGNFFIPNTFSPNGDGMNDVFFPRGTGVIAVKSFRIYNRWGEVVFERTNIKSNNPLDGWDGMLRGKLAPADVYIYTCEIVCSNNDVIPVRGDVTLIR